MNDKIQRILNQIRQMEQELLLEIEKKEREFFYEIKKKKVLFEAKAKARHRTLVKHIPRYLREASLMNMLSAPVIWSCVIPAALLDFFISIYQRVCFPIYGIPRVPRKDFVVIDRHYLAYLNIIEKINCVYCAYFIGVLAYTQEIAARTEQYWCPVKHARRLRTMHSRYGKFMDYGDADAYREKIEEVRRDFDDLR